MIRIEKSDRLSARCEYISEGKRSMIMVLPFIIALLAILCLLGGYPRAGLWGWAILMGVYLVWCQHHMTDALGIVL